MLNRLKEIINKHPTHAILYFKKDKLLYEWIFSKTQMLDNTYTLLTRIFWILNRITEFPKCENCGKSITKNIKQLKYGYSSKSGHIYCCHKCATTANSTLELRRNTCLTKYGVDSYTKTQECKNKNIATCISRYGVKNGGGSKQSLEKAKKTNLDRRGVEYTWQSEDVKEKSRATNIKKYGAPSNMQSEKGKQEYRDAMIKLYGYDHNWKIPEKNKDKVQRSYEKFGKENYNNREKAKQTWLTNYGVDHPSKDPTIRKKQIYNCYEYDGEKFNSSWEIVFWIYCKNHGIQIEHEPISLDYVDSKGASHKYFPDFRIYGNQLVEIKGDDQFDKTTGKMIDKLDKSKNYIAEAKHQCMIMNNVIIIRNDGMQKYLDYIKQAYGKGYLKQFKKNKKKQK